MRILVILPFLPYPLTSGGHQATFRTIDYIREYHNITLCCPEASAKDIIEIESLWPDVKIRVARVIDNNIIERKNKSFNIFSGYGMMEVLKRFRYFVCNRHISHSDVSKIDENFFLKHGATLYNTNFYPIDPSFIVKISDLVERTSFDIIQVEFPDLLGLVEILPMQAKKIFVHHEIRFVRMEREMKTFEESGAYERYLIEIAKRQEIMLLSQYDLIITLSELDRITLSKFLPMKKIVTSSFPITDHSLKRDRNVNHPYTFNEKIVFLGGSGHYPNFDAVNWFLNEIWEELLNFDSNLTFYIVGKWAEEAMSLFRNKPKVCFTGYVDDLAKVMEGAIMVVPLRIGSGIRSKIFDAISLHTPIVSTSIGKEGLPLEDGKECFVADDPVSFVWKIRGIIERGEIDEMCSKALKKIETFYSKEVCGSTRNEIYCCLTAT
ncbi:MAG: glycosyltransferase [Chitinophagaceae bacterium]|nr:MAG: glycosyltransferase [Chitinophagaceae bacterium]